MDRELDRQFVRRRRAGRLARVAVVVLVLVGLLLALPEWLTPSIRRVELRTATVAKGDLEAVLAASGVVVPASESVLSCPLEARVVRILKHAGELVKEGDEIVELDTTAARLDLERLEDRIAKNLNEQEQLKLDSEQKIGDLEGRLESGKADLEVVEYQAGQRRKLHAQGLLSEEALKGSEAELKKSKIALAQLERALASERKTTQARLQGLELDQRMLTKDRDEARRQLDLATTRSQRSGVLTWVIAQEGATVQRGEVLAKVANLDSFRLEATISDVHAGRLAIGQPVRVMADQRTLVGHVSQLFPTIENGAVKFLVELENPSDEALRSQLRVDVFVVTGTVHDRLIIKRGAFARDGSADVVFVVRGNEAIRRNVRLGLSGQDGFEVIDGLDEGDEIILNDMRDYNHLQRIRLK